MFKVKRAFNLLWGVNQGCGLLLARGLEKRRPVSLVNTLEKIECSLTRSYKLTRMVEIILNILYERRVKLVQ